MSNSQPFTFQITLQQLHLNITPIKLKLLIKYNTTTVQSKPIAIKHRATTLSDTFCFDCNLSYRKSKGERTYVQKHIQIKLVGKEKQVFGLCTLNLAEFANRNSFYYQNQIKVPIEKCQDRNAYLSLILKLNRFDYNIGEHGSTLISLPKLPPLSFGQNRKVLGVSRLIEIQDIEESSKTWKTDKSNRTFPEEDNQGYSPDNFQLASKLESLFSRLESITDLSTSKINGIEVIKQTPEELLQSSLMSSRNIENKYKELQFSHNDLKEKYNQLLEHYSFIESRIKVRSEDGLESQH